MRFLFLIGAILSHLAMVAQNTTLLNADFSSGVAGWSATGGGMLTPQSEGYLTPGAARIVVAQSGNYPDAQLKSPNISTPDEHQGKMHFLAFAARGTSTGSRIKLRVEYILANGSTDNSVFEERELTADFRQYGLPVYIPQGTQSVTLRLMCGEQSGTYAFDDIQLYSAVTPPQSITQFPHWQPRYRPVFSQAPISGTLSSSGGGVQVWIDPDSVMARVLSTQFGVNSNFRSGNDILDRTASYTSFGSLRFPAGSGSNTYFWDCSLPSPFAIPVNDFCGSATQYLSPENFITFKNAVNGEATVVVNYMLARYGVTPEGTRAARVRQAARYAAEWVHYFNHVLHAGVKYWEIGNECYGPWETGFDVNGSIITGTEYGEDFNVFVEEMKAVDPDIRCGAVLWHKGFNWNEAVIKEVGNQADFFIVHHYFEPSDAISAADALLEIEKDMQHIQASATFFSDKPPGYFPVAFTEFNIQGTPATTILNGLFVAEALATMVKNGFFMTNIWVNEWNIDADYHSKGILAQNDALQADFTPRPSFTPFYFFRRYFGDEMLLTRVTGNDSVRGYASSFSDGTIGAVMVNYGDTPQQVSFNFENSFIPDSIYWHSVSSSNMNAGNTKFWINGYTSSTAGGGPVLDQVPPFAATWIPDGQLTIPPFSATYIAMVFAASGTGSTILTDRSLTVMPNPATNSVWIRSDVLALNTEPVQMINSKGQVANCQIMNIEEHAIQLDCTTLAPGVYTFLVGGQAVRWVKL